MLINLECPQLTSLCNLNFQLNLNNLTIFQMIIILATVSVPRRKKKDAPAILGLGLGRRGANHLALGLFLNHFFSTLYHLWLFWSYVFTSDEWKMIFDWLMCRPEVLNKLWSTSNASNYCRSLAMPYEMVYVKESAWYGIWDLSEKQELLIFQVQSHSQSIFKQRFRCMQRGSKRFKTQNVFQSFWHCSTCISGLISGTLVQVKLKGSRRKVCSNRKSPDNFLIFYCFSLFKHQHLPYITWLSR